MIYGTWIPLLKTTQREDFRNIQSNGSTIRDPGYTLHEYHFSKWHSRWISETLSSSCSLRISTTYPVDRANQSRRASCKGTLNFWQVLLHMHTTETSSLLEVFATQKSLFIKPYKKPLSKFATFLLVHAGSTISKHFLNKDTLKWWELWYTFPYSTKKVL